MTCAIFRTVTDGLPPLRPDPPERARTLILGSFPGARSLADRAYYAHPHNRFWPTVGALIGFDHRASYATRIAALTEAGIAVWDVLAHCERRGSLDTAIVRGSEVPNDFAWFFDAHPQVQTIAFNGAMATMLFGRHIVPLELLERSDLRVLRLPSTSPANAGISSAGLLTRWESLLSRSPSRTR